MYKKISDYGIIGNLRTIALIGLDGSCDWLCFPFIDSPFVFGALLDDSKGGRFQVRPAGAFDSTACYEPETNVLVTRFRTRTGILRLTDFMHIPPTGHEDKEADHLFFYRHVLVERGEIDLQLLFQPRFDYARQDPVLIAVDGGVMARAGQWSMALTASLVMDIGEEEAKGAWPMSANEEAWFKLASHGGREEEGSFCHHEDLHALTQFECSRALKETRDFWQTWLAHSETGRSLSLGSFKEMVQRSALALKLLYFDPTGTIAAAATTSLPEEIGGIRNWDYRFTWIRDTSFTLTALFHLGHLSETEGYLRWIEKTIAGHGTDKLQIMYGLRPQTDLAEVELAHLDGYKGSRPVRIGNAAARQKQMDIYGELMEAAAKLSDYVGKIDIKLWPALRGICDYVSAHWQEPDYGIWEVRGGPRHYVYSKVMCWVALDRGLIIAERYGFPADLAAWRSVREKIRHEVLDKGYCREQQSFIQHYDGKDLDASNLLLPLLGFLPFDDPRIITTIEATRHSLSHKGLLYRYQAPDGLDGEEGTFLLCTFWLVDCLIGLGRLSEAENLLGRLERTANHLGLFAEEYDVRWQEPLGNFPQAFTHIGYINSVIRLLHAREKERISAGEGQKSPGLKDLLKKKVLAPKYILNNGPADGDMASAALGTELKTTMNLLRGAFFQQQRVAYEQMKHAELYQRFLRLTYNLKKFDPAALATQAARTAFWINLYNVIVIHGVIELNIRDSVKEVRSFFTRIAYAIGGHEFTPNDIEHGILRGNRKPPNSLFRVFGDADPRRQFSIEEVDPRIHFALVCASRSCPPIEVYTHDNLDHELEIAGQTFVNGGGVEVDVHRKSVRLSRVFAWYHKDFGEDIAARLKFAAAFLYDERSKELLINHGKDCRVSYQDYNWSLNRKT
ncbi:MAG: glycoside hydrolase family 15 protein [Desulfurivibrionaceae bacterium]|nr:glycoside hydrolase family 15 protein [Desulfurivibrionaceae bacterium]